MSAVTYSALCVLLSFSLLMSACQAQINGTAGETVTLPCKVSSSNNIVIVKWTRSDLTDYVFLYRDGQSDPENQHPSFKSRTKLKDKQMNDGDVSLILENVMVNFTGTYECDVILRGPKPPKSFVHLTVEQGHSRGHVGLIVGLTVGLAAAVAAAASAGFVIYRKLKGQKEQMSY